MARLFSAAFACLILGIGLVGCTSAPIDPIADLRISAPFALAPLTAGEAQATSSLLAPFVGHVDPPPRYGARHVTQGGTNVGFVAVYAPATSDPDFFQKAAVVFAGERVTTQSTILGRAVWVTQGDQPSVYYQLGDRVVDVVGSGSVLPQSIALALIAATK